MDFFLIEIERGVRTRNFLGVQKPIRTIDVSSVGGRCLQ